MRANAPITAALALAALSLLPAPLEARPTHLTHKSALAERTVSESSRHTRRGRKSEHVAGNRQISQPTHAPHTSRSRAASSKQQAATHHERKATQARSATRSTAADPQSEQPAVVTASGIEPALYNKRGRLVMPAPLRGSREILLHQNIVADRDGLYRIQNDEDLDSMRDRGLLVALPTSISLEVDDRLPLNRRYARPWTSDFLAVIARAHYARFHGPLQVTSAVRTVEFQQHLIHINGNAAPADGDLASPHLTGQAIDIAKHGLSLTEIAWLRGYLLPLVQEGKIDVEEEFQQSCFHISVYKRYLPTPAPVRDIATAPHPGTEGLATAIR
jgi:Family of unknown function (DUF5715)